MKDEKWLYKVPLLRGGYWLYTRLKVRLYKHIPSSQLDLFEPQIDYELLHTPEMSHSIYLNCN